MGQYLSNLFDQVLIATADGPFFPDREFTSLFGRTKAEYRAAVGTLQAGAAMSREQHFLLHGALNNLLGYPHNQEDSWNHWLPMPPEELDQLFATLKATGHEA
jgi:hypothetical protein